MSVLQMAGPVPRLKGRPSLCLEKLNRLHWAAGLTFIAYGARIGVRVTDASVIGDVQRALPPGARVRSLDIVDHLVSFVVGGAAPGAHVRRLDLLYAASQKLSRTLDRSETRRVLASHLEQAAAELARRRLFVHAGVVGWKGRAILIPGTSHSGKSRLVAALLSAGAEYFSDEYAVFDAHGRVHAYPRPLSLRNEVEQVTEVGPDAFGAVVGVRPLPVGLIVLTRYWPGARWKPTRLSPGHAMLEVLGHTLMVRRRPEQAVAVLERVAPHAETLKGVRGEAAETARLILRRLEAV
jgi:hypothetical protein